MADFVTFNEFIDRVASAKIDYHAETLREGLAQPASAARGLVLPTTAGSRAVAPPVKDDEVEEEFSKMKAYLLGLYKDVRDVRSKHTFLDRAGNSIDCITADQQASVRAAKKAGVSLDVKPPSIAGLKERGRGLDEFGPRTYPTLPPIRRGLYDTFDKEVLCPEDRVPLRRITLPQLTRLGKFDNFFYKGLGREIPPPAKKATRGVKAKAAKKPAARPRRSAAMPQITGGNGETHRHAICTSRGPAFGCSTWLNLWDESPAPGVFNLSQLWIIGRTSSGGRIQTIESGWQIYPDLWGTQSPALFVFFNRDSYSPGNCGYVTNRDHVGFIQRSPNWAIGSALPGPYSTHGGEQFGIQMEWQLDDQGNWWMFIGGDADSLEPLGFFPAGAYSNGTLGDTTQGADTVEFGGEVASRVPNQGTGPMGSGRRPFADPAESFRGVAFQKLLGVQGTVGGPMDDANAGERDTSDSDFYQAQFGTSPRWGSYFFYGGAHAP